jgi:GNAT superfamily N-acetyltransferase
MTPASRYYVTQCSQQPYDAAHIAALHLQVREWQVEQQNNQFSDIRASQADLLGMQEYYLHPGGEFFVAHDNSGAVVGFVGLRRDTPELAQLKRMAVLPDHHRQGVGTLLLQRLLRWAEDDPALRTIRLATGAKEYAQPMYERAGFVVTEITYNTNEDRQMELQLDSSLTP